MQLVQVCLVVLDKAQEPLEQQKRLDNMPGFQQPEATPQVKGATFDKIISALDQGLMPGSTEYYQHLGMSASDRGMIPSKYLGPFDFFRMIVSPDARKLSGEQQMADKVGFGLIDVMAKQQAEHKMLQANAPPITQLNPMAYGPQGAPLQPNQVMAAGRPALPSEEGPLMQRNLASLAPTPIELQTLQRRSGEFAPLQAEALNPNARATLPQMEMQKTLSSAPYLDTQARLEAKRLEPAQPKSPVTVSDENRVAMEMYQQPFMGLTPPQMEKVNTRMREEKFQHPVGINTNRIAQVFGGKDYDTLPTTPLTKEDVARIEKLAKDTGAPYVAKVGMNRKEAVDATLYQRGIAFAQAGASARAMGELEQPAGPEAANYYDVNALKNGRLISASDTNPGITKRELRTSAKYKVINPNDQQELQGLNNARNTLRELFTRSESILEPSNQLKASTVQPAQIWAWANGGPGSGESVKDKNGNIIGTRGEIAKSFLDQQKSFGGVIARGVLAERGVLTDTDREVASRAGVNSSDTVQTMKKKQDFFERLMNFQFKAIARLSDNPGATVADLVKEKEQLMSEARKFPVAQTQATVARETPKAGTVVQGYRFKGDDPSKKENWEKVK